MDISTPPAVVATFSAILPNGDTIVNVASLTLARCDTVAKAHDVREAFKCERSQELNEQLIGTRNCIERAFPGCKVKFEISVAFMRIEAKPKPQWN